MLLLQNKLVTMFWLVLVLLSSTAGVPINDDNWAVMLEGEWMVEFYAPWCPACRNLKPVWDSFTTSTSISVGEVDVTTAPGLSGRFMITALPTIYHVNSGEFRQYRSPRTKEDLLEFVEDKKWTQIEPISAWQAPDSIQMGILAWFYRVSMGLRNLMNSLTADYGLPYWSTYVIFGGGTILIGLLLGLLLVLLLDCVYPPKKRKKEEVPEPEDEIAEEEVETEEEEKEETEPSQVRKRPRKAD